MAEATKRKVHLNVDELTLGDLELFEEACGGDLMDALTPVIVRDENGRPVPDPDDPKGRPLQQVRVTAKTMVGLIYLTFKKEDENITLADVKKIPLSELDFTLDGLSDDADPTPTPDENTETAD